MRSKEIFSIEAGAVRIENYLARTKWQQEEEQVEEEEETIHKLTTFNLGTVSCLLEVWNRGYNIVCATKRWKYCFEKADGTDTMSCIQCSILRFTGLSALSYE